MSALSANQQRAIRGATQLAFKVANAVQVYGGSYLAIDRTTGYVKPFTGAASEMPIGGFAHQPVLGNTGATVLPEAQATVDGHVLFNVAVTGVTAVTDIGKYVYLSNDNDLTLTPPTRAVPNGMIVRWHSSTSCDVYMFGIGIMVALLQGGGGRENMFLGSFDLSVIAPSAPAGTKLDLRTGIVMPYAGQIVKVYAITDVAITVAATGDSFAVNLEIDGTDVTMTAMTFGVQARNTQTTSTPSALNSFSMGSLIDIEAAKTATGDDLTAGRVDFWMTVLKTANL